MPPPIVYGMGLSAGTRLALWTADLCNVQVEFKNVNLWKKEHMTDVFVELTAGRHCIPALEHDAGGHRLRITESRAIARYMTMVGDGTVVGRLNVPAQQAVLDQLVDYDATCLYPRVADATYFRLYDMKSEPTAEEFDKVRTSLTFLAKMLGAETFMVAGRCTVADLVLSNTLGMLVVVPEIDIEREFPALWRWNDRLKKRPTTDSGAYQAAKASLAEHIAAKQNAE